jgi:hypothetical protein
MKLKTIWKNDLKNQCQLVLTFETCDRDHEPNTYCVEGKPENNEEKFSIKKCWGMKLLKKILKKKPTEKKDMNQLRLTH